MDSKNPRLPTRHHTWFPKSPLEHRASRSHFIYHHVAQKKKMAPSPFYIIIRERMDTAWKRNANYRKKAGCFYLFYLRSYSGPPTSLYSTFVGFSPLCLLAATMLNSFFLFYLSMPKKKNYSLETNRLEISCVC